MGYQYDIGHYANAEEKIKAEKCYLSLGKQLLDKENHKFQYKEVEKGGRAQKYYSSVEWLLRADIVSVCKRVTDIKYDLNDYGPSSAYCNGNNRLFISGGEKNNLNYNNKFWKINLDNQGIDFIEMEDKKNHSMIYIPGGYVFIVGGINKKTFCYDEQNNQIWLYGNLNI
mgnify:CR=1 FL=1